MAVMASDLLFVAHCWAYGTRGINGVGKDRRADPSIPHTKSARHRTRSRVSAEPYTSPRVIRSTMAGIPVMLTKPRAQLWMRYKVKN